MLSQIIKDFFIPIFKKHKKIFFLLGFDGLITGLVSVLTPLLLKLETDQLMLQQSFMTSFWELRPFTVFFTILLIILMTEVISRLVSRISEILMESERDYIKNHIQLELFRHMNMMEVGRAMNGRFKYLSRILESEFSGFPNTILNLPKEVVQRTIQIVWITTLFAYFNIIFLFIVVISATLSFFIEKYRDVLQQKYEMQWKFTLGQKIWFYSDLFLRSLPELATNGAIKSTLTDYQRVLDIQSKEGLKKNWADLTWTVSWLFTGSVSSILIKLIVGYGVFRGTESIWMVALVVSSMGTVEENITRIFTFRKDYLRFRFQESSILLFLEMCAPIGYKDPKLWSINSVSFRNIHFAYPNLNNYELQYLHIAKDFMKWGKTWTRWIDEKFEDMIQSIESDLERSMPIVLDGVSLHFEKWKIYGIVGKNGAWKTTLMQLLAWFFRSYSGEILLNDLEGKDFIPEVFASKVSFLTQQPFFMGYGSTILQNLSLWVETLDEWIMWNYLEKFWLAEKIMKSPDGIESEVWEKIEFSGGEKQILTFIRLLLQDRPIIIMDEGTNQLDAENEIHVMDELLKTKQDKIIIFITHRMSTISKVDYIYCLEGWKISASWGHRDLLDYSNVYSRFYRSQVLHDRAILD